MINKPHVVIIMADQLRYDVLGKGVTPQIDAIAQEGIQFNRSYCASPLCVPERGAFFTGTYPNVNGSLINPWIAADQAHGYVRKAIDNLYTLMEEEWDSYHSGKQHLYTEGGKLEEDGNTKTSWVATEKTYAKHLKDHNKRVPGGPRFRTLVPELVEGKYTRVTEYSIPSTGCYEEGYENFFDGYYTQKSIEAIRNRDKNKPLLLNAMYLAPHPPFDIPEPWYSKIKEVVLPENVGMWYDKQSPLQMYNLTGVVGTRYTTEEWREVWRVYLGLVNLLDDCVGKLVEELKAQGIYDETLIIFTSDHGEMLGSHKLFQKMCMYEESVRTPLYIKFPKAFALDRKICDHLVSGIDVFPTLCEYLGLQPQHKVCGQSLMPLIKGEKERLPRAELYIQFDGNGARSNFQRCIVQDAYKLITDLFKDEVYISLYDVIKDPQETTNLAFEEKYDKCIEELFSLLKQHMQKTNDWIVLEQLDLAQFRENYLKTFEA